jgi:hypothetical protein
MARASGIPLFRNCEGVSRYSPPRMTARRGGRAIKKISRSIRCLRGRGGVPIKTKGKPPRLRRLRWLRDIFLVTQPPLLAVMQGGEYAHPTGFPYCYWSGRRTVGSTPWRRRALALFQNTIED